MRSRQFLLIASVWLAPVLVARAQTAEVAPAQPAPVAAPAEQPAPAPLPTDPVVAPAPVVEQPAPAPVVEPVAPAPEPQPTQVTPPLMQHSDVIGDPVVVSVPVETPEPAVAPQADAPEEDLSSWMLKHRRFSTRDGSSGGLWIEDPSSGAVGAVRLQLALNIVPEDDFAETGNDTSRTDKAISVSWTALPMLEIYGLLEDRSTSLALPEDSSIYAQGSLLGAKMWKSLERVWSFGGGLRFGFNNEPGSSGPLLKATNISLRGGASANLQDQWKDVPLIGRVNLEYTFDNSAKLVEDTENERFAMLEATNGGVALPRNETRNLVSRMERYALDINRVDTFALGLGVEAPLAIGHEASIHPLLEYRLAVPINRQDFDCAIVRHTANDGDASSGDDCLATAGASAWPMNLALGARVVPPVRGLSLLFALDLGLTGSSKFVRELAPTAPFSLIFAIGYDYDARP